MKKRIQLTLLLVVMSLLSFSATAHDFEVDGFYYNITDVTNKTVEVTFSGNSYYAVENEYSGNVVIPNTVTYNNISYSVTTIGAHAFYNNGLTSVTIPNSVTSIGDSAFFGCTSLTSVAIGDSVTTIGDGAFFGCTSLTSVAIGDSVTTIGDAAFDGCSALTSVTIPNSVTSIGASAFRDCTGLTSITIPNSVISIGNVAFYNCPGVTKITIGKSVEIIGWETFGLDNTAIGYSPCLKQIISLNPTPPTCASNGSFYSDYYTITTLYVPQYCYGEYRADDNEWIRFKNIEVFGINLSQTYATLPVNDIMTLSYTVVPSTASVEWSTSNPDVAGIKVNSDNSITVVGIAGGKAYITAKVAETGSSAWCHVTVGNAGIDGINQDNTATEIARYDIHGRQLTQPASGINIIKMSDGTTRKEFVK